MFPGRRQRQTQSRSTETKTELETEKRLSWRQREDSEGTQRRLRVDTELKMGTEKR